MEIKKIYLTGNSDKEDTSVTGETTMIDMWYDPHLRLWTLTPMDSNRYQTGNAEYAYGKKDAMLTKKHMEDRYGITESVSPVNNLIGKEVTIKAGIHRGDWGIVVDYDGEYYHVAMFGDENDCPIFNRDEIKVSRKGN